MLSFIGYTLFGLLCFGSLFAAVDFARSFFEKPKNLWISDYFAATIGIIVITAFCFAGGYGLLNLLNYFIQNVF